ncbi:MAG TPA: zinc ABC transporter substrate-binding protein [Kiritimatiellia bacterium]|nr:zinc ABC transporter substrate-binding protein [Kiritimatiellia bacterium]
MKRINVYLAGCVLATMITGAARAERPPLRVTATVGMVADVVREVGGPRVTVTQLIGSGIDPHLYKPTRSDVSHLLSAQVVFYSGLKLEGKMGDTLARLANSGREVQAVTEALSEHYAMRDPENERHLDPHVWMDVAAWIKAAELVANVLSRVDPKHAGDFALRAADYRSRLEALDAYVRSVTATIPQERRILVTAHDAFHYFGRAYNMQVLGIQGISTESEAGLARINQLVDLLVDRKLPAIFVESSVADRNVRALVEGARARGHAVAIGGTLFSDAMGETGTYEGTYIGMIDHNATTIVRALGGEAPAGGFQGRLRGAP